MMALIWDIGLFPAFGLRLKHWLFLGLEPCWCTDRNFHHQLSGALARPLKSWGFPVNNCFIIRGERKRGDIFICVKVLFLWRFLTDTDVGTML